MPQSLRVLPKEQPDRPARAVYHNYHNLPHQPTPLIGREREVEGACELLRRPDVRLLTLVGPPGSGKTRLGIEIAANLLPSFADGLYFVSLAPLTDPTLVASAIAQVLGVKETGGQSITHSLQSYLSNKQLLLVLDNFEQVVTAAPLLSELFAACPGVKVLVTSREVLHLYGEHDFPVPPLSLPDPARLSDLEAFSHCEAVALFLQRAQAVRPSFRLTKENAPAVAEICLRLDGLPLAIELAAARILVLSPEELLARLKSKLRLLRGGARDLPKRQRSLYAAVDWSYNLLEPAEQALFRRLGVFVGGCTLDALEQVCGTDLTLTIDILDGITSLVGKSLLQRQEMPLGASRFTMLETIREYAAEKLEESGEVELLRRLHALYFLKMVEEVEPQLRGPEQALWFNRLEEEQGNLRAALDWAYCYDIHVGLRLVAALGTFWVRRGHFSEGKARTSAILSRARDAGWERTIHPPPSASPVYFAHAQALYTAGYLEYREGNLTLARSLLEESASICRGAGDKKAKWLLTECLTILGVVVGRIEGMPARARLHQEALGVAREIKDDWSIARSLYQLGQVAHWSSDYALERAMMGESLALLRETGDKFNIGLALIGVGRAAEKSRDYQSARDAYEESLLIFRELGDRWAAGGSLYQLGSVALYEGDYDRAKAHLEESLAIATEIAAYGDIPEALEKLGRVAYFQNDYAGAYELFRKSLVLFQSLKDQYGVALCLMNLAGILAAGRMPTSDRSRNGGKPSQSPLLDLTNSFRSYPTAIEAVQVMGAAQGLFTRIGFQLDPASRELFDRYADAARNHLGEPLFTKAFTGGQSMSLEQAIACVLQTPDVASLAAELKLKVPLPPSGRYPDNLTKREVEVLHLIAAGKSNQEIARELVLSLRTVERHIANIYQKIGATGRIARATATAYALRHGLTT